MLTISSAKFSMVSSSKSLCGAWLKCFHSNCFLIEYWDSWQNNSFILPKSICFPWPISIFAVKGNTQRPQMFPRKKHRRILWELYFWYPKFPLSNLGQIFHLDYISHGAAAPSGLMMFSGRWSYKVFALQGSQNSGITVQWETATHFQTLAKKLSFFSWMSFLPKISAFYGKNNNTFQPACFSAPKGKCISEELYTKDWIFSWCQHYEHLLWREQCWLKEAKD